MRKKAFKSFAVNFLKISLSVSILGVCVKLKFFTPFPRCISLSYAALVIHALHWPFLRCIGHSCVALAFLTLHWSFMHCIGFSYAALVIHALHRSFSGCTGLSRVASVLSRCFCRQRETVPGGLFYSTILLLSFLSLFHKGDFTVHPIGRRKGCARGFACRKTGKIEMSGTCGGGRQAGAVDAGTGGHCGAEGIHGG